MKKSINIIEICESGAGGNLFDYDALPSNVKGAVDVALNDENNSVELDIYKDGIQFLCALDEDFSIRIDEPNLFMGTVYFYG